MNNKKTTKRALLSSVMAMLICITMLIGTTFAWFTDSASTAVNKIQAGTLDIALEMKSNEVNVDGSAKWVSAEGKTLGWVAADSRAQEQIFWEPGATYALPELRIVNKGNLALKYKVVFSAINGDEDAMKLAEVLDVSLNGNKVGTLKDALTSTDTDGFAHGNLTAKGTEGATSGELKITVQMQTTAGNDYQGLSIDGIAVTLLATQDTVENDSFGNQYDKDAPIVYPAGVTTESFAQATSVYYYGTYGGGSNVRVATGDDIQNHPAAVAYVDANGDVCYAADVYCAVANGATTIYCKENATVKMRWTGTNRTPDLTADLTVYANGADLQYGEIALNGTTPAAEDITVKVYDAKNLYIWGYSPAGDKAATVLMENCHNIGVSETSNEGRMFYISNSRTRTNGTIHATLRNCSVEKSNSPVYMNADGSLTLENCTFTQCAVPVNNNYKSSGTRTDVVKDCRFIRCGCTAEMDSGLSSYSAPIRFVKSGTGTLTVTLNNNTFSGTIGTNGDILLGDHRPSAASKAFKATIFTANPVMVKSSAAAAYSYNGGTVNVLDN